MSYKVAAIVSKLVTATPSSAQGAHHGQDNLWGSALFVMRAKSIVAVALFRRVNFPCRNSH